MGDRTNIVIRRNSAAKMKLEDAVQGAVVLYSHWGGHSVAIDLAKALRKAESRWHDSLYGSRIIVSQIIGENWSGETGYGLTTGELGDNEHAIFVVDFKDQRVRLFGEPGRYYSPDSAMGLTESASWSFSEFTRMSEDEAHAAHLGY